MNKKHTILRMSLGGAICGAFLGIFAGGLLGGIYGWLFANVSVGLDSALIAGAAGCVGGAIYGAYQSFHGGDADRQSELRVADKMGKASPPAVPSPLPPKRTSETASSETSRVLT